MSEAFDKYTAAMARLKNCSQVASYHHGLITQMLAPLANGWKRYYLTRTGESVPASLTKNNTRTLINVSVLADHLEKLGPAISGYEDAFIEARTAYGNLSEYERSLVSSPAY